MEAIREPGAASAWGERLLVDTPVAAFETTVTREPQVAVPIRLDRGITRAEIRFLDPGVGAGERRRLCVSRLEVRPD
jgi:hypothetical protein